VTSVASKSIVMSPCGAAAQTTSSCLCHGLLIPRSSSDAVALTALQAVEIDATSPNSSDCDRSASRSLRQSAPSAMATARWVRTTPGSWAYQRDAAVDHRPPTRRVSAQCDRPVAQQRGARVRHEIAAVGGYHGAADRAATMHLQGGLLLGCMARLRNTAILPAEEAFLRGYWQPHDAIARIIEANGSGFARASEIAPPWCCGATVARERTKVARAISSGPRDVSGRLVLSRRTECPTVADQDQLWRKFLYALLRRNGGVSEHINAGLPCP